MILSPNANKGHVD